jgi:hypothetical protein
VRVKWRSLECTRSLGEWADHDDVAVLKYIVEIKSPSSETLRFAKLTAATGWANVQLRGKLTQLRNKYRSREIELLWMWAQRTLDQILGGTAVGNVAAAADGAELDGDAVPPPPPPLTSSTPLSGRRRHQSRRITSAGRRPYGRSGSEGDEGDDDAADNERDGADVVEEFGDADRVEENEFDIDDDGDDEDESRDAGGREISADEEYREGDEDGSGSAEHGATKLRNMSRHQTATKRRFADLDQQLSTPMIAAKHMRTGAVNVAGGASSTGAAVLIAHQNQLKPLEVPSNMPTLLVTATPGASRVAAAMAVAAAATSTASTTSMSGTVPLLPPPARKLAAAVADSGAAAEADDLRMPPASLLPSLLAIPIPFTAAAVAAAAAADGVRSGAQQNPALQLPGIASLLSARLPMPRAPSVPTFQS